MFPSRDKQERIKEEMSRYFSLKRLKLDAPVERGPWPPVPAGTPTLVATTSHVSFEGSIETIQGKGDTLLFQKRIEAVRSS